MCREIIKAAIASDARSVAAITRSLRKRFKADWIPIQSVWELNATPRHGPHIGQPLTRTGDDNIIQRAPTDAHDRMKAHGLGICRHESLTNISEGIFQTSRYLRYAK